MRKFFLILRIVAAVAIVLFAVYQQVCWFRDGSMSSDNFVLCVLWFALLCLSALAIVKVFFPSGEDRS